MGDCRPGSIVILQSEIILCCPSCLVDYLITGDYRFLLYKKFPCAKSTLTRKVVPCTVFFLMRKLVLRIDLSYAIPSLMHCVVAALLDVRIQQQLPAKLYHFFNSIHGLLAVFCRLVNECATSQWDNDCLQFVVSP
jgi:hypothetical protein